MGVMWYSILMYVLSEISEEMCYSHSINRAKYVSVVQVKKREDSAFILYIHTNAFCLRDDLGNGTQILQQGR